MLIRAVANDEAQTSRTWVFCRGLSAYKKEQPSVKQDIKSSLLEFKRDCFWALQNGIDWPTRLGSRNQKELLDNDIINVIQNVYGVVSVQDFQSSIIERSYSSQCNIYSIYSQDSFLFEFSMNI